MSEEYYIVAAERTVNDNLETLIIPDGYEKFFVYGGKISFVGLLRVDREHNPKFLCPEQGKAFCKYLNKNFLVALEEGIEYRTLFPDNGQKEDINTVCFPDSGEYGPVCEKTEIIKRGNPRFWDIFIEKYVLETSDYIGYRMIDQKVGRKYLKSAPKTEEQKNELWNAIIWLPNDIVKERNADGSYSYKEGAGNTGYNPWRD